MAGPYDAIVLGAGHNGLVAAAYLGRTGKRVLVLERRSTVGGAAATEEFHPGFRASTGATLAGLLRPEIIRDLGLAAHGLHLIPCDPEVATYPEDGRVLRLWRDPARARAEIAARSPRDADAYGAFVRSLTDLAGVVDPLMLEPPPEVSGLGLGDTAFLARRFLALRRLGPEAVHQATRLPTMSVRAALDEWFEGDLLKATLAFDALLGVDRGPWSPGTAFGLIHQYAPAVHGGAWSFVKGGMGALAASLAAAAKQAGAEIRTDAEVGRILTRDGRVTGVEMASGETIPAGVVLSNADPKRTFLRLLDPSELPLAYLDGIRAYQCDGCVSRVSLALDGLPASKEGPMPPHVRIAPSLEYVERACDDAKYGSPSREPVLDAVVPSLVDPDLAPPGKHVMSVLVQYTPYHLAKSSWEDRREKLGDLVVDLLESRFPGLRKAVLAREVLTPADLEARFGLSGGHIYHGEMTLNQQLFLRPVPGWARYRTPVEGLFLCGSGAHPGGGISGAPGHNAAKEALAFLRRGG